MRVPSVKLGLPSTNEEMLLAPASASGLENLMSAAQKDNIQLVLGSGFRSYDRQYSAYQYSVSHLSENKNENLGSRPGTNEHQTGLAVDINRPDDKCALQTCFGALPEGLWLEAHAYEYGFVVHYANGKEAVTGVGYEPWHLRFVGTNLAQELHRMGQTIDEFFGTN